MYKILAVDDEPHALKILKLQLEDADYEVITATNGEEALAALDAHPDVDCILLDRMMPKMNGMEFVMRQKSRNSPHRHIPVIMQTAKNQEWDEYEGTEVGAIHYITKPYTQERLLAAVEAVLRNVESLKEHFARKSS